MEFLFLAVWLIFTMFAIYGLIRRIDRLNERVKSLEQITREIIADELRNVLNKY